MRSFAALASQTRSKSGSCLVCCNMLHRYVSVNRFVNALITGTWPVQSTSIATDGYDAVIEVCGTPAVLPVGLKVMAPGGCYVFVGMVHPASSLSSITAEAVIRKCATIVGVHNYRPQDLRKAVDFLADTATLLPYMSVSVCMLLASVVANTVIR
jgi:threonine dehydrogenase-like Zn-dependent dehydrogenase